MKGTFSDLSGVNIQPHGLIKSKPSFLIRLRTGAVQGLKGSNGRVLIFLFLGGALIYQLIWLPAQSEITRLRGEQLSLEEMVHQEAAIPLKGSNLYRSGEADLPVIFDKCCRNFSEQGVQVTDFKMEMRGERDNGDYILVHIQWQGEWSGIIEGLTSLEQSNHWRTQELNLVENGGHGMLKIFFPIKDVEKGE